MKNLLFLVIGIILPYIANSQTPQSENSLRVEGVFITKEIPEMFDLTINISYNNNDFSVCSDSLLIIINNVTNMLINNRFDNEKIKISNLTVVPKYDYDLSFDKRVRNGFEGRATLEVNDYYSSEIINKIFNSVNSFDYDIGYSLNFSLSEEQKIRLRKQTIEKAIEDARDKADIAAKINNIELDRINRISIEDNFDNLYRSEFPLIRMDLNYEDLELNPKEMQIIQTVIIEWFIKDKVK